MNISDLEELFQPAPPPVKEIPKLNVSAVTPAYVPIPTRQEKIFVKYPDILETYKNLCKIYTKELWESVGNNKIGRVTQNFITDILHTSGKFAHFYFIKWSYIPIQNPDNHSMFYVDFADAERVYFHYHSETGFYITY